MLRPCPIGPENAPVRPHRFSARVLPAPVLFFVALALALLWGAAGTALGQEVGSGNPAGVKAGAPPVIIGLDAEFGHRTSTSAPAIRQGILLAIDEINAAGGVLGGRPLALVERDNRSVPARADANIRELATVPDLVAVFCGKFSPVVVETIDLIHELKLPLMDPWAAVDRIIDNNHSPNYAFRLSLRDGWAIPALLAQIKRRDITRVGVMIPNTSWGRSSLQAIEQYEKDNPEITVSGAQWYNWGEKSLLFKYQSLLHAGAQAVLLVANETEGALLVREMAALPEGERRPIFSHWGVSGGDFYAMTEGRLDQVDFSVVQTFTFVGNERPRAKAVLDGLRRRFAIDTLSALPSQVGVAHAYDLTHILAHAIEKAGTTDRAAIRDALERGGRYDGLIRTYNPAFTPERHEALSPETLFVGRFTREGIVRP